MPQTSDNNNRIGKNMLLLYFRSYLYNGAIVIYEPSYIAIVR